MTYAAELNTLENHFATQWGTTTPIQFENDGSFKPPTDHGPYVRFWLLQGDSRLTGGRGNGTGRWRHVGVVQIDIFDKEGNGTQPVLALADQAAAIFRDQRVSDVLCRSPSLSKPAGSGGYYRVAVSVGYQRDEILL